MPENYLISSGKLVPFVQFALKAKNMVIWTVGSTQKMYVETTAQKLECKYRQHAHTCDHTLP